VAFFDTAQNTSKSQAMVLRNPPCPTALIFFGHFVQPLGHDIRYTLRIVIHTAWNQRTCKRSLL